MGHWEATGLTNEWYTPAYIFEALGCRFDLDVAAPVDGPLHVPCTRWLSSGGLEARWDGFVWMNPPFGGRGAIEPWLGRFILHPPGGIALTPDRTSAPWFQQWAPLASRLLFMPKVRFLRPDGAEGVSPSCGTVLWANGAAAELALERAAGRKLGILMRP